MRVLLVFAERRGLPTPHDAPRTTKTTQPTTSSECPSRRKIGKRNHPLDSKMATSRVIDGVTAAPRRAARRPHLSPRIRERRRARTPIGACVREERAKPEAQRDEVASMRLQLKNQRLHDRDLHKDAKQPDA